MREAFDEIIRWLGRGAAPSDEGTTPAPDMAPATFGQRQSGGLVYCADGFAHCAYSAACCAHVIVFYVMHRAQVNTPGQLRLFREHSRSILYVPGHVG